MKRGANVKGEEFLRDPKSLPGESLQGFLVNNEKKEETIGFFFLFLRLNPILFAEREGFEPPVPFSTSVFKTDAIDHSAIFPLRKQQPYRRKRLQKYYIFLTYARF